MSKALELADLVEDTYLSKESREFVGKKAAAELRRLDEVNAMLLEALKGCKRTLSDLPSTNKLGTATRRAYNDACDAIAKAEQQD